MEAAELLRLVVAASVLPAYIFYYRALRTAPGRKYSLTAFASIYASYVWMLLEDLFWPSFFNALQHLSYGVAGVFSLLAVLAIRRQALGIGPRRS
ncbi:MAG: hypothetical protein Q8K89_11755 [Actinomycetota bacterium]|nr:hypothetical protein [Actinomycetota bacterium]